MSAKESDGMLMYDVESQPNIDATSAPSEMDGQYDTVNLAPYVVQLIRGWRTIAAIVFAGIVIGLAVGFLLPPKYTAESSFLLPSGPTTSAGALAAQLGNSGSLGILGLGKTPGDMLIGVLQSHTVLSSIVSQYELQKAFHLKSPRGAEKMLLSETKFDPGTKDSIVTITVTDKSAARAQTLANAYLDALQQVNENFALTESSQRRLFFEKALEREKEALASAEVDLKQSQEQTGLIQPASQATLQIDTIGRVRAEIASRQVLLASLQESETDQNPQVVRLKSEIADLQRQLGAMQNGSTTGGNLPTSKVPELALEEVRKEREVKYHETLFDILARQYESARMDESKVGPTLQVLDRATLPEGKSGPSKTLILILATAASAFLGVAWTLYAANAMRLRSWYSTAFLKYR